MNAEAKHSIPPNTRPKRVKKDTAAAAAANEQEDLVGKRIRVLWPDEKQFFSGVVTTFEKDQVLTSYQSEAYGCASGCIENSPWLCGQTLKALCSSRFAGKEFGSSYSAITAARIRYLCIDYSGHESSQGPHAYLLPPLLSCYSASFLSCSWHYSGKTHSRL